MNSKTSLTRNPESLPTTLPQDPPATANLLLPKMAVYNQKPFKYTDHQNSYLVRKSSNNTISYSTDNCDDFRNTNIRPTNIKPTYNGNILEDFLGSDGFASSPPYNPGKKPDFFHRTTKPGFSPNSSFVQNQVGSNDASFTNKRECHQSRTYHKANPNIYRTCSEDFVQLSTQGTKRNGRRDEASLVHRRKSQLRKKYCQFPQADGLVLGDHTFPGIIDCGQDLGLGGLNV